MLSVMVIVSYRQLHISDHIQDHPLPRLAGWMYHARMQDVIDGDLCEQYPSLPMDLQKKIAEELDRTPGEILKKLEDIRNRIL